MTEKAAMSTEENLARARAGDGQAFRELTEPYQRELQVHCYRMLGSMHDAEDVLQETLLAAWSGLAGFEGRSSLRSWLYRIATNRCLNALRAGARRVPTHTLEVSLPAPTRYGDPSWLEPYPDVLLDGLPDRALGPEAHYESRESISLAFLVALQNLPPRQRAVLVLRDVLGFRAAEVADMLDATEDAISGVLKRARATLAARLPDLDRDDTPLPHSPSEQRIVEKFSLAFVRGDIDAILALLTEDTWMTMPPLPMEYQGPSAIGHFLTTVALRDGRRYRLLPTRANGQPAYGCYLLDPRTTIAHAQGLLVLTLSSDRISRITRFIDNGLLAPFGLPRSLR
jgi:RNA polymerase sigma-70 factor (TIGR02960 family)